MKKHSLLAFTFLLLSFMAVSYTHLDVTEQLQQLMILDYLICNPDRHFGNFGAIRDAVTLEWMGFAPIFDSGTSLWFDQYATKINALADARCV